MISTANLYKIKEIELKLKEKKTFCIPGFVKRTLETRRPTTESITSPRLARSSRTGDVLQITKLTSAELLNTEYTHSRASEQ